MRTILGEVACAGIFDTPASHCRDNAGHIDADMYKPHVPRNRFTA